MKKTLATFTVLLLPLYFSAQETNISGTVKQKKERSFLMINSSDAIAGDIIYNGDAAKWKKLINSFRLKVLMTLSKKQPLEESILPMNLPQLREVKP